ncbi:UNVERIFIED_CONTAM: hypothetical protein HDU68_011898, partial [Siphonaria sp. JEL0065]
MKTELLDSKIELSRSLEKLETQNDDLTTKLNLTEKKLSKLESELESALTKRAEVEEFMKQTVGERDKIKLQIDQELKKSTNLSTTIKHLELKNKELTVELIGVLNNKSNFESTSGTYKSELEKLKKHNEYLKKKIEISQKSSFNMGHEIERLLQSEQEKLRKEVLAHEALKSRISELQALNKELTSNLDMIKETFASKESSMIRTHKNEIDNLQDRVDKMANEIVELQGENDRFQKDLVKWQNIADEQTRERMNLQSVVDRLQNDVSTLKHNVTIEQYRSKLERMTADVMAITKMGGKSTDVVMTANQLFKQ